ncbi:hypothetical protein DCC77_00190 [Candidatus Uhrbacteria bacterium]|nr:MAG: hypothetical protein DCC77_00190 [Candidatus Uhrbacteria bacterium]
MGALSSSLLLCSLSSWLPVAGAETKGCAASVRFDPRIAKRKFRSRVGIECSDLFRDRFDAFRSEQHRSGLR